MTPTLLVTHNRTLFYANTVCYVGILIVHTCILVTSQCLVPSTYLYKSMKILIVPELHPSAYQKSIHMLTHNRILSCYNFFIIVYSTWLSVMNVTVTLHCVRARILPILPQQNGIRIRSEGRLVINNVICWSLHPYLITNLSVYNLIVNVCRLYTCSHMLILP